MGNGHSALSSDFIDELVHLTFLSRNEILQ